MTTRSAAFAALVLLAAIASSASSAPPAAGAAGPPQRYIVMLRASASLDHVVSAAEARLGFRADRRFRHAVKGFAARLSAVQAQRLASDASVTGVALDKPVQLDAQTLPAGIDRVQADVSPVARINGVDGRMNADIAIIDTGIQKHPDLNVVGGYDCSAGDGSAWGDEHGHGTHVAGTAAALDNGFGVVGVAPGARLWAVRVFTPAGFAYTSSIVCGVDWVAGQRDPADPSRPRIEVANMSLRGAGGDDGRCGAVVDDPLHAAICTAVDRGTTFVVAAGNDRSDSSRWVPAAYDEVITVSALADFNGRPGGGGSDPCGRDVDDTFADFSNYGADVDLIAPGSCVYSTMRGSTYGRMSGTSMATPAVAGGAALYAATHPGAPPAEIRAALIATGSSDWTTSTDPDAVHEPLLDVSTLAPAAGFSLAGTPTSLVAAPGTIARYDLAIGRLGGFSGDITFEVTGAPPGSTVDLDPNPVTGPDGSATAMAVGVPVTALDGTYTLTVLGRSGVTTASHQLRLVVATPDPSGPRASIALGAALGSRAIPLHVTWPATSGATGYQLQMSDSDGAWTNVSLPSATATSASPFGWPGHTYRFRVRASSGGTWGAWRTGPMSAVRVHEELYDGIEYSGTWATGTSSSYYFGRMRYATAAAATASLSFTAQRVAWVTSRGTNRGKAAIYVDGVYVRTVDLYASSFQPRRVMFTTAWPSAGPHRLTIRVSGTGGRPQVDVDAIVLLR